MVFSLKGLEVEWRKPLGGFGMQQRLQHSNLHLECSKGLWEGRKPARGVCVAGEGWGDGLRGEDLLAEVTRGLDLKV